MNSQITIDVPLEDVRRLDVGASQQFAGKRITVFVVTTYADGTEAVTAMHVQRSENGVAGLKVEGVNP